MSARCQPGPIHRDPHPLAGQTVTLAHHPDGGTEPVEFELEDWYDRVTGHSWLFADGNPAALKYAIRSGLGRTIGGVVTPMMSDEVVYGHIGPFGHIVAVQELETVSS